MSAPEGRPEVMGRPANAYLGVFLGVLADSCFQDHCSTLRSRLRSISRACKHVARMHGAVLRLSRADKLRSVSSVPAGLSGGRHAINYHVSGGHRTHMLIPALTANQVAFWHAQRLAGSRASVIGYGRIIEVI